MYVRTKGLIKEPKNIDFSTQSIPWTDEEFRDFRNSLKAKKVPNMSDVNIIKVEKDK